MTPLKNTKITGLEVWNGTGYFDIECGRFGKMIFSFDIHFNVDSEYELQSVDVKIGAYEWELVDGSSFKFDWDLRLNNRNTKSICKYIEEIILSDPYSFGFDENNFVEEFETDFEEHYYGNRN